jgi:cytochrome b pre-mRNA-processing protein 3
MLNILDWLRGRSGEGRTATELYGSIVTQARNPVFYGSFGVADVAEKRYEMIVLHIVLVLERLRGLGAQGEAISQGLVEAFVRDLDGSMREMAVSDTKVPSKVKKAAGGLLDRDVLYRSAFDGEVLPVKGDETRDTMTPRALISELIFDGATSPGADGVWRYTMASRQALQGWKIETSANVLPFPGLDEFLEGAT